MNPCFALGAVARAIAALSGGAPSFTYSNAVLRLPLDGADAATAATDYSNNVKTITFHGNAQLDTAQSKWGGASLLLDGTGDYIQTVTALNDFRFGTGDFTLGCWVRTTAVAKAVFDYYASSIVGTYQLYINGSGVLEWYRPGSAVITATGTPVNTGEWVWIAAVRTGTTLKLLVNGAEVASVFDTTNYNSTVPGMFAIGAQVHSRNAAYDFAGHIDDALVLKGEAYLGLPTGPLPATRTSVFSNVVFQMPAEGPNGGTTELVDVSSYARTINRYNGAAITTAYSASGGSSLDCTDTKFVTVPSAAELNVGSTGLPFTIEGFLRLSTFAISSSRGIVCKGNASAQQFLLYIGSSNQQRLVAGVWNSAGTQTNVIASADHLVLNAFKHFAMTWDGATVRIFYDGALVASAAFAGPMRGGSDPLDIGNLYSTNAFSSTYLNGLLDDVRINHGQCLYVEPFTPPTPPFPTS